MTRCTVSLQFFTLLVCCLSALAEDATQTCRSSGEMQECTTVATEKLTDAEPWRTSLGWMSPKLAAADILGVRGVVATERMAATELVVKQPFTTVINGNSMMWRTPFAASVSQKFWSKADSIRKVVCRLAVEIGKGKASRWAGWVDHLPRQFNALPYWSQDEMEELQNEVVAIAALHEAQKAVYAWEGLMETTPDSNITLEEWRWAWTLVGSRSFSFTYLGGVKSSTLIAIILGAGALYLLLRYRLPTVAWWILNGAILAAVGNKAWGVLSQTWVDSVAMLPLMDVFNHATDPNLLLDFKASTGHLHMVAAPQGIRQGEEVFISYGNYTNDHYLMVYGFTMDDNPEEKYQIMDVQEKLLSIVDVSAGRLKYVNNTELTRKLKQVDVMDSGFKVTDIQAIAQLICDDTQFVEGDAFIWNEPSLEARVFQTLALVVKKEIQSWPNSIEEDDRLIREQSAGMSERWHLAVHYRRRRKQVLLNCLRMVRKGHEEAQEKVDKKLAQEKPS